VEMKEGTSRQGGGPGPPVKKKIKTGDSKETLVPVDIRRAEVSAGKEKRSAENEGHEDGQKKGTLRGEKTRCRKKRSV